MRDKQRNKLYVEPKLWEYRDNFRKFYMGKLISEFSDKYSYDNLVIHYLDEIKHGTDVDVLLKLTYLFVKHLNPKSVLEPYSFTGELLSSIMPIMQEKAAATYITDESLKKLQAACFSNKIVYYDNIDLIPDSSYDCIINDMPKCSIRNRYNSNNQPYVLEDGFYVWDRAIKRTYEFQSKLSDNGYMLLFFSTDMLKVWQNQEELRHFEQRGLFINAIIEFADELYPPNKGWRHTAVIFSWNQFSKRLYAKAHSQIEFERIMEEFMLGIKCGKFLDLWKDDLDSMNIVTMEYSKSSMKACEELQGKIMKMKDVISGIMEGLLDVSDSVYIPMYGKECAVTESKAHQKDLEYFHIICNPQYLHSKYMVYYLNSQIGRKARYLAENEQTFTKNDSLAVHMTEESLLQMDVIVPDLQIQEMIISKVEMINSLQEELNKI